MSKQTVGEELILRFEARAVAEFGADAHRADARAMAAAVNDEARHGKAGTVRDADAVYVFRMTRCFRELRERRSSQEKRNLEERERYADLYVALFDQTSTRQLSPVQVARAMQAAHHGGYPHLQQRLIEKLLALGDTWLSSRLTRAAESETPRTPRRRAAGTTEGRRRAASHG